MAKQRYINTKFWSDNFISELNPLDRYLFLYFLTNEHTNICGIYEVPLKTISFETGLEFDMLKKMLKRLTGKVYYIDGWVYLKNFAKHQAVNESIIKGIESSKKAIPQKITNKINEIEQGGDSLYTASPQDPTYLNLNSNLNSNPNEPETSSGEVESIIKEFENIDPKNKSYYNNKTQRKACKFLLSEYGLEKVMKAIHILPKINTQKLYVAQITTPYELQQNWVKLGNALKKSIDLEDNKKIKYYG